jgi:hypothetical protein
LIKSAYALKISSAHLYSASSIILSQKSISSLQAKNVVKNAYLFSSQEILDKVFLNFSNSSID